MADVRDALRLSLHALPKGWAWRWLTNVLDIEGGTQPPADTFSSVLLPGYVRLVQIRDFSSDAHLTFIPDNNKWRKCYPNDVLIARYGAALGRICRGLEGAYNVALAKVVPVPGVDLDFLHHLLRSRYFQDPIHAMGGRSAQAGFNKDGLAVIAVPIPPNGEQKAIAAILGALDDKIELNKRMNKTLEVMARAIFKDWFVDFGPARAKMEGRTPYLAPDIWSLFPDRLDDEGKPEGWSAEPLDQIADFLNGLALQKYPPNGGDTLPVIKIAQLRAGSVASADRASTEIPSEYVVADGDILFSWSGSLLHRVWTAGRGALNQHLFKVASKKFPKWFYFYWIAEHMPSFQATAASKATTMGHIQRHHLTQAATVVGTPALMEAADHLIAPLFNRQIANDLESRTLATIRDFLLPKLMSGEVGVCDAEKAADVAVGSP